MKEFHFYLKVRAETQDEARAKLIPSIADGEYSKVEAHREFFVHPDGQIRPCDVPPEGYRLLDYGDIYNLTRPYYECLAVREDSSYTVDNLIHWQIPKNERLKWRRGKWIPES